MRSDRPTNDVATSIRIGEHDETVLAMASTALIWNPVTVDVTMPPGSFCDLTSGAASTNSERILLGLCLVHHRLGPKPDLDYFL